MQYVGLSEETRAAVTSHIAEKWASSVRVAILPDDFSDENVELDALLVVSTNDIGTQKQSSVVRETIRYSPADIEEEQATLPALLFEVDAKLGRLSHSDLAKTKPAGKLVPEAGRGEFSRRELILSVRKGFQRYSDAPVVFQNSCEARLGCRTCIEVCPTKALNIGNKSSIVVSDADCQRCGVCAAACRVTAIQMPRFSEASFSGLVNGVSNSQRSDKKTTLVITCNASLVEKAPWMDVEQVQDVGVVGSRQLLKMLVSSSFDALVVCCPDGLCLGKKQARQAVESVLPLANQSGCGKEITFLEGMNCADEIRRIHSGDMIPDSRTPITVKTSGRPWEDYVASIKALENLAESHFTDAGIIPLSGLQLTYVSITRTCTLCNSCVSMCPHHSFSSSNGELVFDPRGCTACGLCAKICPERSINLLPMEKMDRLKSSIAFKDAIVECARCGKPLGTRGFLHRVQTLVGEEDRMMKFCSNCKQKQVLDSLMNMGLNRR